MIHMDAPKGSASNIPFVDAHHHLWDLERHKYSWLEGGGDPATTAWIGDYSAIRQSYLVEDYLRDAEGCGLIKSIHVQAGWSESDPVGETRWLQQLADHHGFPNGIVAEVDLTAPGAEQQLDRHMEYQNFRGVRMMPMAGLVVESAFRRGFSALAQRNLSYDFNTRVPYMAEGAELARKFPNTVIVVNNTGNPLEDTDEYFDEWRKEMFCLARFPNIVVKISGLGMGTHEWTTDSIRQWILTTIDLFGTNRCMFATNWPVDRLYSTYQQLIQAYRVLTSSFSLAEQLVLFSSNAEQYYRV